MESRKFVVVIWALVVTVALVASWAEAAEKVQYRLKFEEGKKYYVQIVVDSNTTQIGAGQEQATERVSGFGYNFDVEEVDENGCAWIKCTYAWTSIKLKGPEKEIVYDSSKKGEVPASAVGLVALLGESFYLRMTPQGQVEKINGLKAIQSYMKTKVPEGPMKEIVLKGLKRVLNEEFIKESFEDSMAIYPDKAVGIGDSWSKMVVVSQGYPMNLERTLKLEQRKDGVAVIRSSSTIKPNLKVKLLEGGARRTIYELSGKQQGQIELQESTGCIIRSELKQDVSGKTRILTLSRRVERATVLVKIQRVTTFEMTERKEK